MALLCALPGCAGGSDGSGGRRQSVLKLVTTIAGGGNDPATPPKGLRGSQDGMGTNALFDYPVDISMMRDEEGREHILVADTYNGVCRVCV